MAGLSGTVWLWAVCLDSLAASDAALDCDSDVATATLAADLYAAREEALTAAVELASWSDCESA